MPYVDGFVIPVPTENLEAYKRMAELGAEVWRDHGALDYKECVADDVNVEGVLPFPQLAGATADETVIFSYIVFESREHRDEVNARVMKDPRLASMDPATMPFDVKRMAYGGFRVLVGI